MISFHDYERDRLATLKLAYGSVPEWWAAMRPRRYQEWCDLRDAEHAAQTAAFVADLPAPWELTGYGGAPADVRFFADLPAPTRCCGGTPSCCCDGASVPTTLTATFEADDGMGGWVAAGSLSLFYVGPGTDQVWTGAGNIDGYDGTARLVCYAGFCQWAFLFDCGDSEVSFEVQNVVCDPFSISLYLATFVCADRILRGTIS